MWVGGEPWVGATLVGATLVGATLVGATLVGATLVGATLVGATHASPLQPVLTRSSVKFRYSWQSSTWWHPLSRPETSRKR
jgi:hypothetical protein